MSSNEIREDILGLNRKTDLLGTPRTKVKREVDTFFILKGTRYIKNKFNNVVTTEEFVITEKDNETVPLKFATLQQVVSYIEQEGLQGIYYVPERCYKVKA